MTTPSNPLPCGCEVLTARERLLMPGNFVTYEYVHHCQLHAAAEKLLAACKELRDALAGAMRVIHENDCVASFVSEMGRLGIKDRIGVRANSAIADATRKEV